MTTETTTTTDDLAAMTEPELAAALEEAEQEAAAARRREAAAKLRADRIRSLALARYGDGEAHPAPSGRYLYRDPEVAQGKATPNEAALVEAMPRLPADLQPELAWKLPSVSAIREAAKAGRLPQGVTAADLLTEPETAAGMRWKTL